MTAAGQPDIKDKLLEGYSVGDKTYKVHLDGYDQTAMLTGTGPGARKEFFYFTDDGSLSALRYNNWKMLFSVQRAHGLAVWQEPYVTLRLPMLFNLRMDPFERAEESEDYPRWRVDNAWAFMPAQAIVAQFLQRFQGIPAARETGQLQPRSGPAEDAAAIKQLTTSCAWLMEANKIEERNSHTGPRSDWLKLFP